MSPPPGSAGCLHRNWSSVAARKAGLNWSSWFNLKCVFVVFFPDTTRTRWCLWVCTCSAGWQKAQPGYEGSRGHKKDRTQHNKIPQKASVAWLTMFHVHVLNKPMCVQSLGCNYVLMHYDLCIWRVSKKRLIYVPYRVLKYQDQNSLRRLSSSASLLLWMQELKERSLSVVTQASQGVGLGSEHKTRLIMDLSIKCRKGIY